ncbi:MAG: hypothetical protein B7Y82_00885 [Sphingomonadales bacterium 32-65-25]|nr:MAG: hypothetical protein B7Y82_00885 [Sphingomonadales bacterium 32-65-25]
MSAASVMSALCPGFWSSASPLEYGSCRLNNGRSKRQKRAVGSRRCRPRCPYCHPGPGRAIGQPVCARRLDRQWRSGSLVISPTLTFTQIVTCHSDQRNSSLQSAAQMTTRLNVRLSAGLSFQIDNESTPKPGCENGDTVTFVKPVYNS